MTSSAAHRLPGPDREPHRATGRGVDDAPGLPDRSSAEPAPPARTAANRMAHITLVEDHPLTGRALAARLRRHGDVTWARSLAEAAPMLDRACDGWVLDQRLPDGDGLAFAERLRKTHPRVPILMFTGHASAKLLERASRRKIFVVPKPSYELLLFEAERWAEAARRRDTALERLEQLKRRVGLTDLQHRVVTLALAGKSRTEAAREMGISPLTHRTHVTRTLRRTRHRRLAQLVAELAGES